jgi:hypothetical protein
MSNTLIIIIKCLALTLHFIIIPFISYEYFEKIEIVAGCMLLSSLILALVAFVKYKIEMFFKEYAHYSLKPCNRQV